MALIGPRLALTTIIPPGSIRLGGYRTMEDFKDLKDTHGTYAPDEGYQESKTAPRAAFVRSSSLGSPLPGLTIRAGGGESSPTNLDGQGAHANRIRVSSRNQDALREEWRGPRVPTAPNRNQRTATGDRSVAPSARARNPIVAASLETMFGDAPAERIRENYSNYIHFNSNGARLSAKSTVRHCKRCCKQQENDSALFTPDPVLSTGAAVDRPVREHISAQYECRFPVRAILTCQNCFSQRLP